MKQSVSSGLSQALFPRKHLGWNRLRTRGKPPVSPSPGRGGGGHGTRTHSHTPITMKILFIRSPSAASPLHFPFVSANRWSPSNKELLARRHFQGDLYNVLISYPGFILSGLMAALWGRQLLSPTPSPGCSLGWRLVALPTWACWPCPHVMRWLVLVLQASSASGLQATRPMIAILDFEQLALFPSVPVLPPMTRPSNSWHLGPSCRGVLPSPGILTLPTTMP